MIPAQASDISTIYTVLDTVDKLMYKLDQRHAVLTFDEALYSKAKEVQWRMPDKFKNLVLRLGGFHTIIVFLAVIGKQFRDRGLEDDLIDCDVYAGNTVEQIFRGKHYNRGALCDWYTENSTTIVDEKQVETSIECMLYAFERKKITLGSVKTLTTAIRVVVTLLEEFEVYNRDNALFVFWNNYIEIVLMALRFIRAERHGIWQLHLSSLAEMLPYLHAYDHTNYARWATVYLADMQLLSETAPEVFQKFTSGNFPVKGSDNIFNQVWTDLKLEQSLNRHSKTTGGLIGMTQNQEATDKWHVRQSKDYWTCQRNVRATWW